MHHGTPVICSHKPPRPSLSWGRPGNESRAKGRGQERARAAVGKGTGEFLGFGVPPLASPAKSLPSSTCSPPRPKLKPSKPKPGSARSRSLAAINPPAPERFPLSARPLVALLPLPPTRLSCRRRIGKCSALREISGDLGWIGDRSPHRLLRVLPSSPYPHFGHSFGSFYCCPPPVPP
jgi:hypothetical protein